MSDDPTLATPVQPAPPVLPTPAPRRASSGRWLNLLVGVAAAVAIGGIAFAVGRGTAPAAARFGEGPNGAVFRTFDPNASFAPGGPDGPGFLADGGVTVEGTVQSVSADTMTVATEDGRTIEVALDPDTEYHQQAPGSAADVTAGSTVAVQLDGVRRGTTQGGPASSGGPTTGTASDVTVIP
jgi:hypothetical protein